MQKFGFNPWSSHTKDSKTALAATLLNTQHYKVRNKVKWSNPGKEYHTPLHLGVVAIEKEAFGSPSTTVTNLLTLRMAMSLK